MIEAALSLMATADGALGVTMPATKLAVLFVVSAEQHKKAPELADKVSALCAENGAQCAILPSPDVLVAALAHFTQAVANEGRIANHVGSHHVEQTYFQGNAW